METRLFHAIVIVGATLGCSGAPMSVDDETPDANGDDGSDVQQVAIGEAPVLALPPDAAVQPWPPTKC